MQCVTLNKVNLSPSKCSNAVNNMTLLRLQKYYRNTDVSDPSKLLIKEIRGLLGKKPGSPAISNKNSKMPGFVFSASAHYCKTGSALHGVEGSVCENCYALKGNFAYTNVVMGLTLNSIGIAFYEAMQDYNVWTVALAELIKRRCVIKEIKDDEGNIIAIEDNTWFRFHDSGDIQSMLHLKAINDICLLNPSVKFWLPTREGKFVKEFLKTNKVATNLCIRISAHMVGKKASDFGTGLPTSTVSYNESEHKCIAPKQGGACDGEIMNCRNCWDPTIPNVDYPQH
jgi:hypothetical protein